MAGWAPRAAVSRIFPQILFLPFLLHLAENGVLAEEHRAIGCTGNRISLSCENDYLRCRIGKLSAKYFHPAENDNECPEISNNEECSTNATDVIYTCVAQEKCAFYVRQEREKGDCANSSQYIDIVYSCECSIPDVTCPASNYPMKPFGMLCYELVPEVRTYSESVQVCSSKNGVLADITSVNLLDFLRLFLDKQYMYGYQWVGNASRLLQSNGHDHCYELRKDRGSTWNISLSACTYRNQFICQYEPLMSSSPSSFSSSLQTWSLVTSGHTTLAPESLLFHHVHIDPVGAMLIAIGVSIVLFLIVLSAMCCLRRRDTKLIKKASTNGRMRRNDLELTVCENRNGAVPREGMDNPAFEQNERPEYAQVVKTRRTQKPYIKHEYDDVCEEQENDTVGGLPVLPPRTGMENDSEDAGASGPSKRPVYENVYVPNIANSLERKFKGERRTKTHPIIPYEKSVTNSAPQIPDVSPRTSRDHHEQPNGQTNVGIYENCAHDKVNKSDTDVDDFYYCDDVFNPADTLGRAQNVDTEDGPTEAADFGDVGLSEQPVYATYDDGERRKEDGAFKDEYDSFEDERKDGNFVFTPISASSDALEPGMYNSIELLNVTDADLGTI